VIAARHDDLSPKFAAGDFDPSVIGGHDDTLETRGQSHLLDDMLDQEFACLTGERFSGEAGRAVAGRDNGDGTQGHAFRI
jgi:hypothetical protein